MTGLKSILWRTGGGGATPRILLLLGLIAALGTGAWYALSLHNRDERIINRHLNEIREQLTKKPENGMIQTAAKARGITRHFTDNVVIDAGRPLGILQGRTALTSAIGQIHRFVDQLDIHIMDRRIEQLHDGHARVYLVLEGVVHSQGERTREIRAFSLSLVKQDGDWLIEKAERLETIKRPE